MKLLVVFVIWRLSNIWEFLVSCDSIEFKWLVIVVVFFFVIRVFRVCIWSSDVCLEGIMLKLLMSLVVGF